jgi:hypothetical protein
VENSKKPNFSAPRFFETELTIKFVEVPIKVQEPPKIPAKEMGNRSFDCEILYFSESWLIIFIKTITTAVVLIKAEIPAVTTIKMGAIMKSGKDFTFPIPEVSQLITPFSSMAMAKIISARTAMVALFEKPLMPSSGVTNPNKMSNTMIKKEILSIGKTSKTKSTIVVRSTKNIKMISKLIC